MVLRAAALVIAAGVALVAQAASGDWTPWLWGVGALFVVVLLGARQRWGATVTATVALVVADLVWLLAMPWWGWVFLLSAACAGGVVWLVYTRRVRVRHPLSIATPAAAGVAVVAASIGAVLHAQAAAEAERRAAAAQRQESISRILPHSPSAVGGCHQSVIGGVIATVITAAHAADDTPGDDTHRDSPMTVSPTLD